MLNTNLQHLESYIRGVLGWYCLFYNSILTNLTIHNWGPCLWDDGFMIKYVSLSSNSENEW